MKYLKAKFKENIRPKKGVMGHDELYDIYRTRSFVRVR